MIQSVQEIIEGVHQNVEEQLDPLRQKLLKIEFEKVEKDQKQVINAMSAIIEELELKIHL